jgi:programmed cell death 6-interacting protein
MQSVKSLAKAVSKEMADSLKGTEELLTLALTKAQKDNNTVYLERVPPFAGARGGGGRSCPRQLAR